MSPVPLSRFRKRTTTQAHANPAPPESVYTELQHLFETPCTIQGVNRHQMSDAALHAMLPPDAREHVASASKSRRRHALALEGASRPRFGPAPGPTSER